MCVIVSCKKRKPTDEELSLMFNANGDGAGIVTWDGKKTAFVKGLRTLKNVKKVVSKASLPFILHFRMASSGGNSQKLTHPFLIEEDGSNPMFYSGSGSVLVHNGHSALAEELFLQTHLARGKELPDGNWSDTRCASWLIAASGPRVLEHLLGCWVIISPEGPKLYGDKFEWVNKELLCSNAYWKWDTTYTWSGYGKNHRDALTKTAEIDAAEIDAAEIDAAEVLSKKMEAEALEREDAEAEDGGVVSNLCIHPPVPALGGAVTYYDAAKKKMVSMKEGLGGIKKQLEQLKQLKQLKLKGVNRGTRFGGDNGGEGR